MYFNKLRKVADKLPLHQESLYVSFQFNQHRIRIEYLTEIGFEVIYTDDPEFIDILNEIFEYALTNGFDSAKEGCIISLEDSRLTALPNPSEIFDSLNEDEKEELFNGDLDLREKEFVIENIDDK